MLLLCVCWFHYSQLGSFVTAFNVGQFACCSSHRNLFHILIVFGIRCSWKHLYEFYLDFSGLVIDRFFAQEQRETIRKFVVHCVGFLVSTRGDMRLVTATLWGIFECISNSSCSWSWGSSLVSMSWQMPRDSWSTCRIYVLRLYFLNIRCQFRMSQASSRHTHELQLWKCKFRL